MINKDSQSHKVCISCGASSSSFITYKKLKTILYSDNKYNYSVVCCKSCGLLFNNPLPSDLTLENFYKDTDSNKSLPNSKKAIKKIKEANKLKRLVSMPFIEKNIGVIKNSKILDIGCDNGGWLNEFDKSNKLIGIETSKANIERAKEFFGVEIIPKPWDCGLIKNSSIDLITSMHTFEHFTNPVNALVCANRALKIGGYIHIQVPSPFGLVFRRGLNFAFKPYHLYYFSEKVLSNLLNQTGFKFIDGRELPPLRFNKKSIFDSEYFASGVTEIIFEKIRTVSSREKGYYPINNHHDELMDHLKLSEKYDLKFIKIYELRNMPFLGLFIKILHKIGTRLFTSNRSKKNLVNQAISLWK